MVWSRRLMVWAALVMTLLTLLGTTSSGVAQSDNSATVVLLSRELVATELDGKPSAGADVFLYSHLTGKTHNLGKTDQNGRRQIAIAEPLKLLVAKDGSLLDIPYSLAVLGSQGYSSVRIFSVTVSVGSKPTMQGTTAAKTISMNLHQPGVKDERTPASNPGDVSTQDYLCNWSYVPDQYYNADVQIGELAGAPGVTSKFEYTQNSQLDIEAGFKNLTVATGWTVGGTVRISTGSSTASTFNLPEDTYQVVADIYGPFKWVDRQYALRGGGYCYNFRETYATTYNGGGMFNGWLYHWDTAPSGATGYLGGGSTSTSKTTTNGTKFGFAFSTPIGFSGASETQYQNISKMTWTRVANPSVTWNYVYDQDWSGSHWRVLGTNTRYH